MKNSIFAKLFVVASLLLVVVACNKYEEGSNFTILTAKSRLVNDWTISKISYTINSTTTETTGNGTLSIAKDGSYTQSTSVEVPFLGLVTTTTEGTWIFNSDKTEVTFTDTNGNITTSTIVKLKNKELSLTSTDETTGTVTRVDYTAN